MLLSAHTTAIVAAAAPSSSDGSSSDRNVGVVSQFFGGFLCWFDG
jgi:hypothetical protein